MRVLSDRNVGPMVLVRVPSGRNAGVVVPVKVPSNHTGAAAGPVKALFGDTPACVMVLESGLGVCNHASGVVRVTALSVSDYIPGPRVVQARGLYGPPHCFDTNLPSSVSISCPAYPL